jgi:hypothetical protein
MNRPADGAPPAEIAKTMDRRDQPPASTAS